MTLISRRLFLAGVTASVAGLPALAQIRETFLTLTPAGAVAEVTRAQREGEILTVTARFTAFEPDYAGEVIYENLTPSEVIQGVYLKTGDRDFGVWSEGGTLQLPDALHLAPHSGGPNPEIVGEWTAVFIAPTLDVREITLLLPGMLPIGHFIIRDR
ncbi:hypothetical protein [Ketogulonicigenium vulgare]|uniref:Uncharacterized protein n=1 Tax=Ketogulonicigenium vulgare (strain WSH-001) TaxID=759362 RepID=F9Y737_KETVW|nr:hypothetical protein [Ketogulonicigenium vulgare]ADO41229.1 hypothetical protein EIO_0038 [Ketogulonicigenium vulgare Y25]AEM42227.1 hypothetical protein KVU_2388 [Ketogulonicigenium vulgare WSH-001]ALJ79849.1 hypothetical protein KVH_00760 [Ketogulonicigenium vulgare]ANW32756.1 hypothetical protein KvSKV_00770 [Ketogulonicigenium vulgare]AOZ53060.1 hypothetical protein KVC_0033 [Ketogulonicigenium vulgare]